MSWFKRHFGSPEERRNAQLEAAKAKLRKLCNMSTEGLSMKEAWNRKMGPIQEVGLELSGLGGVDLMRAALADFQGEQRQIISFTWEGHGGWSDPANKELQRQTMESLVGTYGVQPQSLTGRQEGDKPGSMEVQCSHCRKRFQVLENALGARITCPGCQSQFTVLGPYFPDRFDNETVNP